MSLPWKRQSPLLFCEITTSVIMTFLLFYFFLSLYFNSVRDLMLLGGALPSYNYVKTILQHAAPSLLFLTKALDGTLLSDGNSTKANWFWRNWVLNQHGIRCGKCNGDLELLPFFITTNATRFEWRLLYNFVVDVYTTQQAIKLRSYICCIS